MNTTTKQFVTGWYFYINIAAILLFISPLIAQHIPSDERGDVTFRRKAQLESNQIRTTVFNFGQTGRESGFYTINEETPYEWYKNTGQVYLAATGPLIAAEVINENGDTIHIVDRFHYLQSPTGMSWNFEPVPGYFNEQNPEGFASSDDPSTWPSFWPDRMNDPTDPGWAGSWDGYFGKNVFIDGQELYFKFSDDLYDRYSYYPDTTDLTRKGLGLIISGRAFSFNEEFLGDIVFYSYKIKNDGTKTVNKIGFSLASADFVGEDGQDDILGYDLSKNFIWSYDADNRSPSPAFGEDPVGAFNISFLKYPDEGMTINNIQQRPSSEGLGDQYTDEGMWGLFFTPGYFVDTSNIIPGEYNAFTSMNYFSLLPGETKEIIYAISFANGPIIDPNHSIRRNGLTGQYYAGVAALTGNFVFSAYDIELNSPLNGQTFSDNVNITWTTNGSQNRIADYIYYSSDNGDHWNFLAVDSSLSGNYTWNTQNFPDGILCKIRILSLAENGTAVIQNDGVFRINKSNINAHPQVYIVNPKSNSEISGNYTINLISGDADSDPVEVDLFYKSNLLSDWELLADNVQNNYEFDTRDLPNSTDFSLKATINSASGSNSYKVKHIIINNPRFTYSDSTLFMHDNTPATGKFEVRVVKPSDVTGDDYVAVFENLNYELVYDVINLSTNTKILNNIKEIDGNNEGPYFDGLRLFIVNDPFEELDSLSGWNNPDVFPLVVSLPRFGTYQRSDYRLEIDELEADTSLYWIYPGSTGNLILHAKPVNFKLYNISIGKYIDFAFYERDSSSGSGYYSRNTSSLRDHIFSLETSQGDTLIITNILSLDDCETCINPQAGDIYNWYVTKPFYAGDSIFFSTSKITDVVDDINQPDEFRLLQNYPNPFNPSTKIRFHLPAMTYVQLQVYDILGRKIATIISKEMNAGIYETEFDGSRFASGLYIYRLKAGNYVSSKKMLLLK